MERQNLLELAAHFIENAADNRISREIALSEKVVGMKIYEPPIFAFGAADDPYFQSLKDPAAIGTHFRLPQEWLPEAKTVVSFFLPYTKEVKQANSKDNSWPAEEWLHARIEGQAILIGLCRYLQSELSQAG